MTERMGLHVLIVMLNKLYSIIISIIYIYIYKYIYYIKSNLYQIIQFRLVDKNKEIDKINN